MKTINGKMYYVSIGFVENLDSQEVINVRNAKHFYVDTKKKTTVYVDDSIKDDIVTIPLIQVNDVQKKNGEFKFIAHIHPSKIKFEDDDKLFHKINIMGLFEEYEKDGIEYLKNIAFFKSEFNVTSKDAVRVINIIVDENKILGE